MQYLIMDLVNGKLQKYYNYILFLYNDNIEMFNRTIQQRNIKRHAARQNNMYGGSYTVGQSLMPIPENDWTFAVKDTIITPVTNCNAIPDRPGQLFNESNPALAQDVWPFTGGGCGCSGAGALFGGGDSDSDNDSYNNEQSDNEYTCVGSKLFNGGGTRKQIRNSNRNRKNIRTHKNIRTRKNIIGGAYSVDIEHSIGGNGPIVAPIYNNVSCQTGGGLPVYSATSAGFSFEPSTVTGATLPDGVTAYNNVVHYNARGGKKKTRKNIKKSAKYMKKTKRNK